MQIKHTDDRAVYYQTKRALSFRKNYKPTYAFVNYVNEFDDGSKPKAAWSHRQLTTDNDGNDCNLEKFFNWIAEWAFKWYEGEEVYKKFNQQVRLEFSVRDCSSLPEDIKVIARNCYRDALTRNK